MFEVEQRTDALDASLSDVRRNVWLTIGTGVGLLGIARGDWVAARSRLDASLREAESRQMAEEAAVSLRNLVELDLVEGRLDDAAERLARARRLFESRDDQRGRTDAALLEARLALAAGRPEDAIALLDDLRDALAAGKTLQDFAVQ